VTSQFNPYRGLGYSELCGRRKDYAKLLHAAVAARKYAERNLTLIAEAMEGAPEAEPFEASDHAVVRYLERVHGMDIGAVRETIKMNCETGAAVIGEKLRGQDGFLYCVNNDGFVTTVLPLEAIVDEVAEITRAQAERPKHKGRRRRSLRDKRAWLADWNDRVEHSEWLDMREAAQGMPPEGPKRECGSGASAPASPVGSADAPNSLNHTPGDH
jgi:hypothetical protein